MTILITGTNRGLGFYLADCFLEEGHTVISLIRSRNNNIKNLKKKYSLRYFIVPCNVTKEKEILRSFHKVRKITPYIDILINNAAVHLEQHKPDIQNINFSCYVPTYKVNSLAPLMIASRFLPLIKAGRTKLIVNISSEAGSIENAYRKTEYSYCMSKAALNMASKMLQNRVKDDGIKVLAIHPGWFSSDMGGVDAPVTPGQAAYRVVKTIQKKWSLSDAIYIDPDGKEMAW
ncbi:MAG: SDR family NAD(P)-dependent oxidoreductase [Spirochaetales bacterium]|nr:SDR family NAD(P)-dependent oxidoreductase [Spirochaetales bacterium]